MNDLAWSMSTAWNVSVADIVSSANTQDIPQRLMHVLSSQVPVDEPLLITLFPSEGEPYMLFETNPEERLQQQYLEYLNTLFFLDPCYRAYQDQQYLGFYHFEELAPEGFIESELYQTYFKRHYCDEIGIIFNLEGKGFANLCASRTVGPPFSANEKFFIASVAPLAIKLLTPPLLNERFGEKTASNAIRDGVLENFGRNILTQKEHQVIQLMLHGHSLKSMATIQNRSTNTVKKHQSAIYTKLGISSQRELLPLFVATLNLALADVSISSSGKDWLKIHLDQGTQK